MSDVNNPEVEITEENGTIDFPENFMDAVYDDNVNKEVPEDDETEELEQSDTPDEAEEEVLDDDDVTDDDSPEDEDDDETENDSEDDKDEEVKKDVLDIADLDTNQVIRLADGSELTVDDFVKGNMMQKDYTVKTQALAEERKELEEKQADVVQQIKRFVTDHKSILDAWEEEAIDAENQYLANPSNQEAKNRYDLSQVKLNGARRQYEETEAIHSNQMHEVNKKRVEDADKYATEHIEGWSQDMATELLDYVVDKTGATENEVLDLVSGPMLVIVADAMKQTKGAKVASKKRTTAKKKGKSLKKSASKSKKTNKVSKQAKSDQAAIDRYAESGDFNDLNELFPEDFMDDFE